MDYFHRFDLRKGLLLLTLFLHNEKFLKNVSGYDSLIIPIKIYSVFVHLEVTLCN